MHDSITVRDMMSEGVITCPPDLRLADIADEILEAGVHALFVEDEEGRIVGVVSDIDLLAGEWLLAGEEELQVLADLTANELMSTPVTTADADAGVTEVAARMARERIHRLLVIEAGQPVGVIAISDIVARLGASPVEERTVRAVMSYGYVVCRTDAPLVTLARAMTERCSRSVIVVDADGAARGVLTGFDLLPFADNNLNGKVAADLMHAPVTIAPTASLREAADVMIDRHIHRLVVVDPEDPDAVPLGLVSTSDILAEMAQPGSVWQA